MASKTPIAAIEVITISMMAVCYGGLAFAT
ncbi:MAG: hypothetical protein ACI861_000433, partial [Paracoccaceae bacterium]